MADEQDRFPQLKDAAVVLQRLDEEALFRVVVRQVEKDLSAVLDICSTTRDQGDTLVDAVEQHLADPSTDLSAMLYRVDVPEQWPRQASGIRQLAEAVVVRCAQKVIMRLHWKNDDRTG